MDVMAQIASIAVLLPVAYGFASAPVISAVTSHVIAANAPRQTLEAADSFLAANVELAGPAEGFWPLLGNDALFLEPGGDIVRGRDAIRSMLAAAQGSGKSNMKLHRVAAGRSQDGSFGYTFGWIEHLPEHGAPEYPKYLALWRTDGGQWRLRSFVKSAGRRPPSRAPEGNAVVAGYHGFALPADSASLAAGVAGADSAFAALAASENTCAAFVEFADRNAVAFGPGDFQWGVDRVRSVYSGCTSAERGSWAPIYSESAGSGDLGCTIGHATLWTDAISETASGPQKSLERSYSKYLTVWARQPDGSWKWLLDAGNPRPEPQPVLRDLTRDPGEQSHVER